MSKKHLHNQAAIPLAPAVFKVRFNFFFFYLFYGEFYVYFFSRILFRFFRFTFSKLLCDIFDGHLLSNNWIFYIKKHINNVGCHIVFLGVRNRRLR